MSSTNKNSIQTPEPKRERAVIACRLCRGKKLKCVVENGETKCINCIARAEQCIFAPVNTEQDIKITQSSQGPFSTRQFRVERPTDYANQHIYNAQPTQSSVHSWSLYGGNPSASPPQQSSPHWTPPQQQQSSPRAPVQHAPAYQGTITQYNPHQTYQPTGQYDAYSHHQPHPQHQQRPATEMLAFVDSAYPGSWVQPSSYPNQGTTFPGQFGDPHQSMTAPSTSSMHPSYGHADPNISWCDNGSTNYYYPGGSNDEQQPFDGRNSF